MFLYVCEDLLGQMKHVVWCCIPPQEVESRFLQEVNAPAYSDQLSTRVRTKTAVVRPSLRASRRTAKCERCVQWVGWPDMSAVDWCYGKLSGPCLPSGL